MKALIPIIIIGGVGAAILLTRKKAAPVIIPATVVPTVDDIMSSGSIAELSTYYRLISELLIIGKVTPTEYKTLYDAYYERWYELVGVI